MTQELSDECKQTMEVFIEAGISRDNAEVLAVLYHGRVMTLAKIQQMLGIKKYQCNKVIQHLVKRKWIKSYKASSGKRGHLENAYYPIMGKEELIIDAQKLPFSMLFPNKPRESFAIFIYINNHKKVTKESIIKEIPIREPRLDIVLDELKKLGWIEVSIQLSSKTVFCKSIISFDELHMKYKDIS
ncbi:MarR family transcriptional regulator [Methanolobus bombayensis]|uniref:MarR family transcriptional regulator n=1 Tax=Methanolobus bombayensis TaxID=38023 RepID=UPI001AE3DB85|nr:helix-turn-helix domain-containing protein [Methanolobus bombayensis]MBP1909196.1 putative transcriptional regulator [Methanolobus bombayensis]